MTLIEILVVLAIVTLVMGGILLGGGQLQRSRLRSSASRVAAAMRTGYQRASSTGQKLRLVVDFATASVWLEESSGAMLIQNVDPLGAGGADPATAAEKSAVEEALRVTGGIQMPRATFRPVAGPSGIPQPLHSGIGVYAVDATHEATPRTSGRGYVYFFASEAERASVQLQIAGNNEERDILSVVLAPLTGKATIALGRVPVPHPRDDVEASEAEDDGR